MEENICTILLNRTLNRETDDAPTGTVEGSEYYLNVKNGLKKWEQYIDIAPTRNSDDANHLYIDSYLYQKIRDDLEFLLVYTDLFLLRNGNNENYYPLHCHHTDEHSTGAWIDTQRFLVLEQLDEANINDNGIDIPVESKWGIQKNDGDKLVVTCTVNGNYLIRYITSNDLYILTYVIQYSLNRYVTSYTFVPFSWFNGIVESNFDEYGLYIYENAYYGLFWSLRNNSLRPSLNNVISLILKESGSESEYTFNIYLAEKDTLHWKYNEYLSLFKEGMYNLTEEQNNEKPLILLYPLYFNKDVSLTYIAPDESVTDTKYFIHGNNKSFSHDSYELYKHNYYIPYNSLDVKTLSEELPAGRFRIIESYPCDFNRFNIKISPMWDSELDADPVAIELVCVLKNKDISIADLLLTYIYHKKEGKLICEKIDKDGIFDITGKNKQNLLRSEQSFFLNDDAFKISDLSSVEVTVTPIMIFGPLYDLSKVITIETDKINTNTIELSIYKYYYDKDKIVLTYNIEQYLDANATIYNDSNDEEHCPHCYITKLSDFIANGYRTDKEKGLEIEEISKSLLSSVYNTVNIPLDDYIIPTEIYVIEFCMYIYHLGSFIRRSLFRIMNTTEMFNDAFLDGKMVYSDGLVVENVNDFQLLYLDPGDKYVFVLMSEGSYQIKYPEALGNRDIKYIISTSTNSKPDDPKAESVTLKLTPPNFAEDPGNKASIILRCGISENNLTLPFQFDMQQRSFINTEDYIHGYYDNNTYTQDNTNYTLNFDYQYHLVSSELDWDKFNSVLVKYLNISLMQYGVMSNSLFGIIWRESPKINTCGAFNLSTYGWDDDSRVYLSYMYQQGEFDGTSVQSQWAKQEYSLWIGDYMNIFKLTNCPASNRSFVPVYICGMQNGTGDSLDGDGRMHYNDNNVLPGRWDGKNTILTITGYGNKNHKNAGIPTGGTGELWYDWLYRDYQGQIIWKDNGSNSLQTGIWFALERTDSQRLLLRDASGWKIVQSKNIAKVIAAKLSLYYFKTTFESNMENIYNGEQGIDRRPYVWMLNNPTPNGVGDSVVNVKLNMFAKFGYTSNDEFKLLPVNDNNEIKLYRFINLNDHIQYKVNNEYILFKNIILELRNSLIGDENKNIDKQNNILNNLFFNNLSNSSSANQLVDMKIDGDVGDHFINMIINGRQLINRDDLATHSLFLEYDRKSNSYPVIDFTTDNNDNNKNILCVYPDGNFSVTFNRSEYDVNGTVLLYYCLYNKHSLTAINGNTLYDGLSDMNKINVRGRFSYVDYDDNSIKCKVCPCLSGFNSSDKTSKFIKNTNKFIWNSGAYNYYIRTIYDLANGTMETAMSTVIQNVIHPI